MRRRPQSNRALLSGKVAAVTVVILAGPAPSAAQEPAPEVSAVVEAPETRIEAKASYTRFREDLDPWRTMSVSLSRSGEPGTFILRASLAERFSTSGYQVEADAYPSLGDGTYAYLNAGYSPTSLFPEFRFGAELFRNLGNAWEGSAGLRHLRFDETVVTLYTGSVGKYVGNYWLSARPYIRGKDGEISASGNLSVRRYFADADDYLGGRIGYGSTPSDQLIPGEIDRNNSLSLAFEGQHPLSESFLGSWSLGLEREELPFDRLREQLEVSIGLRRIFR